MRYLAHILAVVSFVLALILAAFVYDMNGKLAQMTQAQGANISGVTGDLAKAQTAAERLSDKVQALQQTVSQNAADSKQNAAAIGEIKERLNKLIDYIK